MSSVKICCSAEAVWPSGPPVSGAAFQDSRQPGLRELSSLPAAIFRNPAVFLATSPDPVSGYLAPSRVLC